MNCGMAGGFCPTMSFQFIAGLASKERGFAGETVHPRRAVALFLLP
jgi:hypothetical protein